MVAILRGTTARAMQRTPNTGTPSIQEPNKDTSEAGDIGSRVMDVVNALECPVFLPISCIRKEAGTDSETYQNGEQAPSQIRPPSPPIEEEIITPCPQDISDNIPSACVTSTEASTAVASVIASPLNVLADLDGEKTPAKNTAPTNEVSHLLPDLEGECIAPSDEVCLDGVSSHHVDGEQEVVHQELGEDPIDEVVETSVQAACTQGDQIAAVMEELLVQVSTCSHDDPIDAACPHDDPIEDLVNGFGVPDAPSVTVPAVPPTPTNIPLHEVGCDDEDSNQVSTLTTPVTSSDPIASLNTNFSTTSSRSEGIVQRYSTPVQFSTGTTSIPQLREKAVMNFTEDAMDAGYDTDGEIGPFFDATAGEVIEEEYEEYALEAQHPAPYEPEVNNTTSEPYPSTMINPHQQPVINGDQMPPPDGNTVGTPGLVSDGPALTINYREQFATNVALREECKARGLPVSGSKDVLVSRLQMYDEQIALNRQATISVGGVQGMADATEQTNHNADNPNFVPIASDVLMSMTVDKLKVELRMRGLSRCGKKDELRDRLSDGLRKFLPVLSDQEMSRLNDKMTGFAEGSYWDILTSDGHAEEPPNPYNLHAPTYPEADDISLLVPKQNFSDKFTRPQFSAYR